MTNNKPLEWQSPEYYVETDHKPIWYIIMGIVAVALILLAIFWMKNYWFVALIVVSVVALIVYTNHPPVAVPHQISDNEITVGQKKYLIDNYKSFGVIVEGHTAIALTPKKRFAQTLIIYFPEASGEAIVDHLGNRLPMQDTKLDLLDRILRLLKI